jgi:hypothetical protein
LAFAVHAWQLPALQTSGQAVPVFPHWPVASQVCGCRLLHVFEPGEQTPPHIPVFMLQTNWQAVPVFAHWPVASQVCG